jgi:hypothetical protein
MIPNQKLQMVVNLPKNVPDDIEKDVTDVIGPKEVMGGSEHPQNEFPQEDIDMNANDQSKQGPETEIGTENPNGPELEGTLRDLVPSLLTRDQLRWVSRSCHLSSGSAMSAVSSFSL